MGACVFRCTMFWFSNVIYSLGLTKWIRYVVVKTHASWEDFKDHFTQQVCYYTWRLNVVSHQSLVLSLCNFNFLQDGEKRLLAFTKRGQKIHSVSSNPLLQSLVVTYIYIYIFMGFLTSTFVILVKRCAVCVAFSLCHLIIWRHKTEQQLIDVWHIIIPELHLP